MSSTDKLCELLDNLEMDYERDGDVIRFRHEGTDRLRAMLDERGVPWKDYGHPHRTWWGAWYAEERSSVNALFLKVEGIVTPEEAATLGRETCRLEREPQSDRLWWCSNCQSYHEHVSEFPWEYCPRCGAKVVSE